MNRSTNRKLRRGRSVSSRRSRLWAEALEPRLLLSAATQLAFLQQPLSTTAGAFFNPAITVEVEDSNGNVIASDSSTVSLSVGVTKFSQLQGITTAAVVNGVATFAS